MNVFQSRLASRVLAGGLAAAALACAADRAFAADAIDCAKADLIVTISEVKHSRDASRSTVTPHFSVTCKGAAVTASYQARTKITHFTEEKSATVTPDSSGNATVGRVEQMDPSGEDITVTVKGSDGNVTSAAKTIPKG
jgi:hypothetical protein